MPAKAKRNLLILLAAVLVLIVVLGPLGLGVFVAQRTSERSEYAKLGVRADYALKRADTVASNLYGVLRELDQWKGERCTPKHLDHLRDLALENRFVQDAGVFADDGRWLCSSLVGVLSGSAPQVSPPDWRGDHGIVGWFKMPRLSQAASTRRTLVLGYDHFYVELDPDVLVDAIDDYDRGIGVFVTTPPHLVAWNAVANPERLQAAFDSGGVVPGSDRFYVIRRSRVLPIAVVVSEPKSQLLVVWRNNVWGWLIASLAVGATLAWLIIRVFRARLSLDGELRRAIRRDEIGVAYQPIVDLETRACVGAEALARWHLHGAAIAPDVFIVAAEHNGLIRALTDRVLERIVRELGDFLEAHRDFYVSINVSAEDLTSRRFLDVLTRTLGRTEIRAAQIRIEATERGFIDADAAREVLKAFREAGHPIYIDDFGTGYSSLSYLQTLPVDVLKIDKSFVDTIGYEAVSSSVAPHIIEIGRALGLGVVAEGVEREDQARYLIERGARYAQGWLFSKALPAEALVRFVQGPAAVAATEQSSGTGRRGRARDARRPGAPSSGQSRV
ncbi:EAL domain-containing protein [Pararobbsia silviterrae]|uniref:cyclic-guanylate-specific phosphodiesterase n=1 Tax=Pararobbsia silviterrae TaxID=1792498 RepID=A0A494X6Z1_9BURK|nr:EAL domain-containing protein [Pararobbsia silviterrae]RKP43769.1 EAL domain-containing protein [Pararobbsia silviterrae]